MIGERFGGSRMYTFEPPILYSEAFSAESLLRSTPKLITRFVTLSRPVPLGLFLVAFPPPPVTFPATRLFHPEGFPSGVAPVELIISLGRCPFLSEQLRSLLSSRSWQAFRLRLQAYWTAAFRSFCPRTVCHHLRPTSWCRSKCP